jgi:flavin reductase
MSCQVAQRRRRCTYVPIQASDALRNCPGRSQLSTGNIGDAAGKMKCPNATSVYPPPVDIDTFKRLMRSMAASVNVITTSHDGHWLGMTATAVCSVSAEPPSILIVVNQSARSHPLISASRAFVVNVLGHQQQALSQRFSGKHVDQFRDVSASSGYRNCPIIDGVSAYFECAVVSEFVAGTHTIFVGRVVGGDVQHTCPAIYHDGAFKVISSDSERSSAGAV